MNAFAGQSFGDVDELLEDYIALPGEEVVPIQQKQPVTQPRTIQPQPATPVVYQDAPVVLEELPVAPEELSEEEPFDLYGWMEECVIGIKNDRGAAENAAQNIQEGIESLTKITRGIQQATVAMAKAFEGADDAKIAKIVALVLAQQAQAATQVSGVSSEKLDAIEKKMSSPLKLLAYAAAGSAIGSVLIKLLA